MRSGPAPDRYDRVARSVHWLVAALAAAVVGLGWVAGWAPDNTVARNNLLMLHRSLGLVILVLMVFALLWRWRHRPPPLPALPFGQKALAHLTHLGLFLIFIVMPLAGYLNAAAAGHPVSLFGLVAIPPLPVASERLSQIAIAVHLLGQYVVYLLVALHVLGALYHGVIRRDGVLQRMLPRPGNA